MTIYESIFLLLYNLSLLFYIQLQLQIYSQNCSRQHWGQSCQGPFISYELGLIGGMTVCCEIGSTGCPDSVLWDWQHWVPWQCVVRLAALGALTVCCEIGSTGCPDSVLWDWQHWVPWQCVVRLAALGAQLSVPIHFIYRSDAHLLGIPGMVGKRMPSRIRACGWQTSEPPTLASLGEDKCCSEGYKLQ